MSALASGIVMALAFAAGLSALTWPHSRESPEPPLAAMAPGEVEPAPTKPPPESPAPKPEAGDNWLRSQGVPIGNR